jgi:hypothetical protein
MIDVRILVTSAIGGVVVWILIEFFEALRKRYFSSRPRLFIEIDLMNPMEIFPTENEVKITFKCRVIAKNKSSLDAYCVCFLFPAKSDAFMIEGASGDFDHLKPNESLNIRFSNSIGLSKQAYAGIANDPETLRSLNPFHHGLKFGFRYSNNENIILNSVWKNSKCVHGRGNRFGMKVHELKTLLKDQAKI